MIRLAITALFSFAVFVLTHDTEDNDGLRSTKHVDRESAFANRHIVLIGDSITRYIYISLLYMLHHKHWIEPTMLPNPVEEKTYESWPIFYGAIDGLFYPYHYCDCSREQMYENSYYINRVSKFFVTYLLCYGKNYPIHARWSPSNASNPINDTTNLSDDYLMDIVDTLRSSSKGDVQDPALSNFEFEDLVDLLHQHVAKLQPVGPFTRNVNSTGTLTTPTASTIVTMSNATNKVYALVMSAGFWPSKFHNLEYSKKVVAAAFSVAHRFIWRTTTFTQFDRKKKRDFDVIGIIMLFQYFILCAGFLII